MVIDFLQGQDYMNESLQGPQIPLVSLGLEMIIIWMLSTLRLLSYAMWLLYTFIINTLKNNCTRIKLYFWISLLADKIFHGTELIVTVSSLQP